jgi:hypothetical protein
VSLPGSNELPLCVGTVWLSERLGCAQEPTSDCCQETDIRGLGDRPPGNRTSVNTRPGWGHGDMGCNHIISITVAPDDYCDCAKPISHFRNVSRCKGTANQHKLAPHRSLAEQFMRATSLTQWNPLGDHWLDLLVAKQIKQRAQIFTKPCRFPPFQILYAVREDASSAGRKESAERVPRGPQYAAETVTQTACQLASCRNEVKP